MKISSDFYSKLETEAARLGFFLHGITDSTSPCHFDRYVRWIENGYHATMNYLSAEDSILKRKNPRVLFSECRSIIVLGYPYHDPSSSLLINQTRQPFGRIASYASDIDYHIFLQNKMDELMDWVIHTLGYQIHYKACTDSSPVSERDLAVRAGLGWIGKNSCLIHKSFGSKFFLAEIFIDITLQSNNMDEHDFCGKCKHCIEACPTQCILPGRIIDSRKCISFLTIENKGSIPPSLRPKISNWVFGCDICQNVCPWNHKGSASIFSHLPTMKPLEYPDLNIELFLTENDFQEKYRNTPIIRAKRKGYLRNVAVALGNIRHPSSVEVLAASLENESEALVRSHVAWALGQFKTNESIAVLKKAYFSEENINVKSEILQGLNP